ncbi:MAG: helix-turn-helix transcriptional regulator [Clostridia bacterium]|nr:helix-turn-helix transcriptional regulator [Clostridia bacterium]
MVRLGEKIKQLRKQKNISQEVLANHLGVSFQAVSKWET